MSCLVPERPINTRRFDHSATRCAGVAPLLNSGEEIFEYSAGLRSTCIKPAERTITILSLCRSPRTLKLKTALPSQDPAGLQCRHLGADMTALVQPSSREAHCILACTTQTASSPPTMTTTFRTVTTFSTKVTALNDTAKELRCSLLDNQSSIQRIDAVARTSFLKRWEGCREVCLPGTPHVRRFFAESSRFCVHD